MNNQMNALLQMLQQYQDANQGADHSHNHGGCGCQQQAAQRRVRRPRTASPCDCHRQEHTPCGCQEQERPRYVRRSASEGRGLDPKSVAIGGLVAHLVGQFLNHRSAPEQPQEAHHPSLDNAHDEIAESRREKNRRILDNPDVAYALVNAAIHEVVSVDDEASVNNLLDLRSEIGAGELSPRLTIVFALRSLISASLNQEPEGEHAERPGQTGAQYVADTTTFPLSSRDLAFMALNAALDHLSPIGAPSEMIDLLISTRASVAEGAVSAEYASQLCLDVAVQVGKWLASQEQQPLRVAPQPAPQPVPEVAPEEADHSSSNTAVAPQ